jgi:glycosyltransferase involved in cell wall biosynthesis
MTTFNGAAYIKQQIESVLNQLKDNDELIIFDDVSTDDTVEIIHDYLRDKRIIFKKNSDRIGVIRNFEQALTIATGDYIFLCDQDDVWLENKVPRMIASLDDHILAVSDCKVVDANLTEIHHSFFALRKSGLGIIKNIYKNSYLGCCMAFRNELLPDILPIPKNVPMHDMWIGLIAETIGSTCFIPEALLLYRRHGKNASPAAEISAFNVCQKIRLRLVLCFLIFNRYLRNLTKKYT